MVEGTWNYDESKELQNWKDKITMVPDFAYSPNPHKKFWGCGSCSPAPENVVHALWGCEKIKHIWSQDFGWVDRTAAVDFSFKDLVEEIREKLQTFALFAITAWAIWHHRNTTQLQEYSMPLDRIATYAKDYIRNLKSLEYSHPWTQSRVSKKWNPPPLNSYKTNFDGAMFNELSEAGIGVVIRNCKGEIMVALSEKIQKPQSVVVLKMLAARKAALFARECGIQQSSFEGDSEFVINSLRYGELLHSYIGYLLKDTNVLFKLSSKAFSSLMWVDKANPLLIP
ncbi:hypothetical protein SO802_017687 [Lithocarpus litseifolius]|uniref:RNase H type-1 domain-containing protein n=1 Tax=Lithocarpus litseifolius TaxID=425828 RepID=A0AAW2CLN5_9ROSI